MLPKCVLAAPPRRGKAHRQRLQGTILRRLADWNDQRYEALWEAALQASWRLGTRKQSMDVDVKRTMKIAREGAYSKAVKSLNPAPLLSTKDPAVLAELQRLHPLRSNPHMPDPIVNAFGGSVADLLPMVEKAIFSFPPMSACGPSGLRPAHLKEALLVPSAALRSRCLSSLTGFVIQAIQGKFSPAVNQLILAARLLPLGKPQGGVRPIAIGDVLRRLVAKVLCVQVRDKAREVLQSVQQLGVASPQATEIIIHGLRTAIHYSMEDDFYVLQVDASNAFNTISRNAIMKAVNENFHELSAWSHFMLSPQAWLVMTMDGWSRIKVFSKVILWVLCCSL